MKTARVALRCIWQKINPSEWEQHNWRWNTKFGRILLWWKHSKKFSKNVRFKYWIQMNTTKMSRDNTAMSAGFWWIQWKRNKWNKAKMSIIVVSKVKIRDDKQNGVLSNTKKPICTYSTTVLITTITTHWSDYKTTSQDGKMFLFLLIK